MCVAPTRAEAEDIAASVDARPRGAAGRLRHAARRASRARALVHEHWGDNVFLETAVDTGIAAAFDAPIKVTRTISHRAPVHGADRGARRGRRRRPSRRPARAAHREPDAAHRSHRPRRMPRPGRRPRSAIVSPDVGGGFGYKGILLPEEICLGWLALRRRHAAALARGPPRAPDRQRQLPRAPLRDHRLRRARRAAARHRLRGDRRFRRLLGLSVLRLPGSRAGRRASCRAPTTFPPIAAATWSVATNKCPILPYRGVARTGVCFALELTLDAVARRPA